MSQRLDLVIINPGAREEVYQSLAPELASIEPPTWVGLLATFARSHGISIEVLDAEAEGWSPDHVGRWVSERDPRLAAVWVFGSQPSASTQKMTAAGRTVVAIAREAPETRTLLGGVHVSALPEQTLRKEAADFVCEGEGPYTILGLVEASRRDGARNPEGIPGLWYREGREIRHTRTAPLISDLDRELPAVAWDLLPMHAYRAHNWHAFGERDRKPYGVIYTTLGCPFRCSFCCINAPFGGSGYRYRSPRKVLDEIGVLVERYGVRHIKVLDEMFALNYQHVSEICNGILERGYDVNLWAYARVDTVKTSHLALLERAGIHWLALGIESASTWVRDGVDKSFKNTDVREVVKAIQSHGIHVIGNFIFGLPDDTHETMRSTLEMAKSLECEMANFYCAMAYPGSRLYATAVQKGWELPEVWHGYSQHARETLPLPTESLRAGEVLRFRDDAFHEYFGNPSYLEMLEAKFGPDTRKHVERMAAHRIERFHYHR